MNNYIIIITHDNSNAEGSKDNIIQNVKELYDQGNFSIICTNVNKSDEVIHELLRDNNIEFYVAHTDFDKYGGKARRIRNYKIYELVKYCTNVKIIIVGDKTHTDYLYLKDLFYKNKVNYSEITVHQDGYYDILF